MRAVNNYPALLNAGPMNVNILKPGALMVNIRLVSNADWSDELLALQITTLPGDEPLYPPVYGGNWWIAYNNDTPAGFACLKDVGHGTVHLSRAGVLTKYRGMGLYPRLVRAGLRHYKRLGYTVTITDCTTWNYSSANGLLKVGYKPFWPAVPWGLPDSIYWIKTL